MTLSAPEIKPLLVSSVVTRLPLAIFSIALLVHAQRLTGSFAVAAAVTGAYAIASALSLCLATTRMQECEEGQPARLARRSRAADHRRAPEFCRHRGANRSGGRNP